MTNEVAIKVTLRVVQLNRQTPEPQIATFSANEAGCQALSSADFVQRLSHLGQLQRFDLQSTLNSGAFALACRLPYPKCEVTSYIRNLSVLLGVAWAAAHVVSP